MIWELGEDTANATLLQSAYQALHPMNAQRSSPATNTAHPNQ